MSQDVPSEHLSVIKVLAAVAWADGEIQKQEALALERILSVAVLKPGERELAKTYIEKPVALDFGNTADLDGATREGIYRAAVRCAAVDKVLERSEASMLRRLREGLKLDAALADAIDAESFAYIVKKP